MDPQVTHAGTHKRPKKVIDPLEYSHHCLHLLFLTSMSHPIQQLTGLPRELLGLIVDSTLPSDQLCLCTTSKLFNSLAVRSLYRNIILRESTDIIRLCKTLVCNSATACAARSLNMSLPIKYVWSSGTITFLTLSQGGTYFLQRIL